MHIVSASRDVAIESVSLIVHGGDPVTGKDVTISVPLKAVPVTQLLSRAGDMGYNALVTPPAAKMTSVRYACKVSKNFKGEKIRLFIGMLPSSAQLSP